MLDIEITLDQHGAVKGVFYRLAFLKPTWAGRSKSVVTAQNGRSEVKQN